MSKRTQKTKTQKVRTRTADGRITLGGTLFGGKRGRLSYLVLRAPDGTYDEIDGLRLYRLAKAVCRRFETAK